MKRSAAFITAGMMVLSMLPAGAAKTFPEPEDTAALCAGTAEDLFLGAYIQMGSYYDEPIRWRVVSFEKISGYDDAGNPIIDSTDTSVYPREGYLPLVISDKILCLKPFDAAGRRAKGSHIRGYYDNDDGIPERFAKGSNYWGDSNLRDWLNSNAEAGSVVWSCGNPPDNDHVYMGYNDYADEAGFLTSFTPKELNAMLPVTQRLTLNAYEANTGTENKKSKNTFYCGDIWNMTVYDYTHTDCEWLTDTVFLLDTMQLRTVEDNFENYGGNVYYENYGGNVHMTSPCVANSEYPVDPERSMWIWQRTPAAEESCRVNTQVYDRDAYDGTHGVRPAFFLSPDVALLSGSGETSAPYIVNSAKDLPRFTLDRLTISDLSHEPLSAIPSARFYASVDVTNVTYKDGGAALLLVAYDKDGRMRETRYMYGTVPLGSTFTFGTTFDNTAGNIASVKAFLWKELDAAVPLAEAVSFPKK